MTTPPNSTLSPTALARKLVSEGRRSEAEFVITKLIGDNFGLLVQTTTINNDWTSLNSINGMVTTLDGKQFFFKFHQEEGDEDTLDEYYQAEILASAGLPVDMPSLACRQPGRQILLYSFRRNPQLSELCLNVERAKESVSALSLEAAQRTLDRKVGQVYRATLHQTNVKHCSEESIHQLFYYRLIHSVQDAVLGGRYSRFYANQIVQLPGLALPWDKFANMKWVINGIRYQQSLFDLFEESLTKLAPAYLVQCGAVTGHGDAHNANVWFVGHGEAGRLILFDPAFAGNHIPALLAEVKATFHNIFAHPFWLYHPEEAHSRYKVTIITEGDTIRFSHDWHLSPLRELFLLHKTNEVWSPLVSALHNRNLLPNDWVRILRCALFCCPTLVTNLLAKTPASGNAGRSPAMSALAFAIAIMAGSEASDNDKDKDIFSQFIDQIKPLTRGHLPSLNLGAATVS